MEDEEIGRYPRWRDELTDQLFKAILLLKNKEECYRFFEDLATINEIKEMSQRLKVAKKLFREQEQVQQLLAGLKNV